MTQHYSISQFAKMAGVTVRTLQYYDRVGLLQPERTESGHRRYRRADLIRLQQIVTLKWMGYPLDEVKAILAGPGYDLAQSLAAQKRAVEAQIERLREASSALDQALIAVGDAGQDQPDTDVFETILHAVAPLELGEWFGEDYDEASWAGMQLRAMAFTPADQERVTQEWSQVFADFKEKWHLSPDHPDVQAVAARMHDLIEAFTGGDPVVRKRLEQFNADAEAGDLPDDFEGHTPYGDTGDDLRHFMQEALSIYEER